MPVRINPSVTVRVSCKCGNIIAIPIEEWDRKESVVEEKSDNAMGNSIEHGFELSDYPCPACRANVDAEFSVYEYPIGTYESDDSSDNVNASDIKNAVHIVF